jgi:hypothetical protein
MERTARFFKSPAPRAFQIKLFQSVFSIQTMTSTKSNNAFLFNISQKLWKSIGTRWVFRYAALAFQIKLFQSVFSVQTTASTKSNKVLSSIFPRNFGKVQ